jgi:hypothetical protein
VNTLATELLFILIALLPNLPHLALDVSLHQTFDQIEALKALGVSNLPLKAIEINGAFYTVWLSSQIITRSPDLETLCLYHATSLPEIPSLKALHLRRFRMSVDHLKTIVSSCTGQLRTFTYEASEIVAFHVDENSAFMIQARDAVQVLEKHNESLESLHLDLRIRTHMSRDTKIEPMPSLESFTALQELFINTDAVYNTQSFELQLPDEVSLTRFLPPNIASLNLVEPDLPLSSECLHKGLVGLADLKRRDPSRFSRLKQVTSDTKKIFEEHYIKNVLSEVGVDLTYKEFPRPDWSYDRIPYSVLLDEYRKGFDVCEGNMPLPGELSDDDL